MVRPLFHFYFSERNGDHLFLSKCFCYLHLRSFHVLYSYLNSNFDLYFSEDIKFSTEELSEIKRVATGHLRLLGFKPLSCLKDYYNLRPSTFVFPSDEVVFYFLLPNIHTYVVLSHNLSQINSPIDSGTS